MQLGKLCEKVVFGW